MDGGMRDATESTGEKFGEINRRLSSRGVNSFHSLDLAAEKKEAQKKMRERSWLKHQAIETHEAGNTTGSDSPHFVTSSDSPHIVTSSDSTHFVTKTTPAEKHQ